MSDSSGDPIRVLHVDDDPRLCELVELYLERERSGLDCRVRTETSATAVLETIQSGDATVDCLISDYRMPGMNGIELLERVRETHPELPVLLFSGEETNEVAREIISAEVTDYLRKGHGAEQYAMLGRRVRHAVDSDGQFDATSETELDGVGVVGRDGHYRDADESYADCYGYDPEEIPGKHWAELHPDEEVEHIRTHVWPVVRDGGRWRGHSEGLRADGTTFTESKMVTTLEDGRLRIAVSELDESDG
ncbi:MULTISPECIES: response regulator [Haloarcula]|uniref:response regulator n=1 Tax=Haloarcula TaxID=2237 RepID=UPI0023E77CC5|nr:response regulator [Halomicroarcula sp. SHR3]